MHLRARVRVDGFVAVGNVIYSVYFATRQTTQPPAKESLSRDRQRRYASRASMLLFCYRICDGTRRALINPPRLPTIVSSRGRNRAVFKMGAGGRRIFHLIDRKYFARD